MAPRIVSVDVETTSLNEVWTRTPRWPWEIGLVDRQTRESLWLFVAGLPLSQADPVSLQKGGYYLRHPEQKDGEIPDGAQLVGPQRAAELVAEFTASAHLLGANVTFDYTTLGGFMFTVGVIPSWKWFHLEVEVLAAGLLGRLEELPERGSWGLGTIARQAGLEVDETRRHSALYDAELALDLYEWCVARQPSLTLA